MFVTRNVRRILSALLPDVSWGDRFYAAIDFAIRHRRLPRVEHPVTFSDHLLRLRMGIEDRIELRRTVADKVNVKEYIRHEVGDRYAIETSAVLDSEEAVSTFSPPVPCVVKAAHTSGNVLFVRKDAEEFERDTVMHWLRTDYYRVHREWFYKGVSRRILVEPIFSDDGITPPDDFKVFCLRGVPRLIQVDQGRFTNHTRTMYTSIWDRLPVAYEYPSGAEVPVPPFLDEMLRVASSLAKPFSFIRVDFLAARGALKVNELTNCPEAARGLWEPRDADQKLGRLFSSPDHDVLELLRA